ncbi:MAG TPA: hypothetical protein VKY90_04925 [Candidatus Dormibacteraeota bacterium]|nr:hypothetical protein [Candidatus Dormibacteraeota bacterium]
MKRSERDARSGAWAEAPPRRRRGTIRWAALFADKTLIIVKLEVEKLRHDPTELVTRAAQPML